MVANDSIADMLTRIRNAANAKHDQVSIPYSRLKEALANIMRNEGFIGDVEVVGQGPKKVIVVGIKYTSAGEPVFNDLRRTSRLGRRVYVTAKEIRPSRQGVGVAILSTSKGVMKDVDAKRQGVGGEVLCTIW